MLLTQTDLVKQFENPGADLLLWKNMVGDEGFSHDLLDLEAWAERRERVLEYDLHLLAHAPHWFFFQECQVLAIK